MQTKKNLKKTSNVGRVHPHGNDCPGKLRCFYFSKSPLCKIVLAEMLNNKQLEVVLRPLTNSYPHSNVQSLIYYAVYSDMSCLDDNLGVGFSTVCCIQYPATLKSQSYVQMSMEKPAC